MTTASTISESLPLDRVAQRLGMTQAWLSAEAETGRIPCVRAGRQFFLSPEAVERVLSERAQGPDIREVNDATPISG